MWLIYRRSFQKIVLNQTKETTLNNCKNHILDSFCNDPNKSETTSGDIVVMYEVNYLLCLNAMVHELLRPILWVGVQDLK